MAIVQAHSFIAEWRGRDRSFQSPSRSPPLKAS
jgi:hypothetical protein